MSELKDKLTNIEQGLNICDRIEIKIKDSDIQNRREETSLRLYVFTYRIINLQLSYVLVLQVLHQDIRLELKR